MTVTTIGILIVWTMAGGITAAQDRALPGQAVFDRVCRTCHGPEGRGDGAPRLVPFDRSVDEVLSIVREGTGQMPPISAREISDEQVGQVVEYLKSLTGASKGAR